MAERRRRCAGRWAAAALALVAALALWGAPPAARPSADGPPGLLIAHWIDVGQGDAAWLRLPTGEDILIDGGSPSAGPTVAAYLRERGVEDLDLIVATHDDTDHLGGLLAVVAAVPVGEAWFGDPACDTIACAALHEALAAAEVPTAIVGLGDARAWGPVDLQVLNPSEPLYAEDNDNSVVLRIAYGLLRLLLAGDAEAPAEGRMLSSGLPLGAEILKVAHHGSRYATTADWLSAVAPLEAIISVGPNSYGHPHPETLARLDDAGARVWRTDTLGTVVLETTGITYTLRAGPLPAPTLPPPPTATAEPAPTAEPVPTAEPLPTATPVPVWRMCVPVVFAK